MKNIAKSILDMIIGDHLIKGIPNFVIGIGGYLAYKYIGAAMNGPKVGQRSGQYIVTEVGPAGGAVLRRVGAPAGTPDMVI